jgi:hypothetical protein
MTRCASLMPSPIALSCALTSRISLTGPRLIPNLTWTRLSAQSALVLKRSRSLIAL